jgi:putative hemolysin
MGEDSIFLVDLDKILDGKLGKKAKYVPRFVRSYLKRIVHQDEINDCIRINADKEGVPFLKGCMDFLDNEVIVEGKENLPSAEERYTFVSNHPLGAMDGISIGYILGSHYNGKIKYLVNDILMNLRGMASLCIPINKVGSQSRNLPHMVQDAFDSTNQMIMFPAGVCSRKIDGIIQDLPWKKTFITESVRTHRDVVPMHFYGENSKEFYRKADIFKHLKLKFNLAMILLPDEMMKNRHKTFKLVIGKPIPWETFDKSKSKAEWAQYVKDMVYSL